MATTTVRIFDERIALLEFGDTGQRNALGAELLGAMDQALQRLAAQAMPVVIISAPTVEGVWSAGHDLADLEQDSDPVAHGKPLDTLLRRLRAYPGVVIAMVSGSVWGAAVDLVMSCDLVVADHSARFTMTPVNLGVAYTTSGLLRFFNNLPIHILKEMFFCARPLDAPAAERFGFVNRLVEADALWEASLDMARGLLGKAPLAIQAIKEQLRILEELQPMPVPAMERIAELRRKANESADFQEGLAAFAERRAPRFTGKPGPDT